MKDLDTANRSEPMIATTEEPKCISEQRSRLEHELAHLDSLIADATAAEEVFADSGARVDARHGMHISVWLDLDDYRDVIPYLQELAKCGYHLRQGENAYYEDDELTCRCYTRGGIRVWVSLTGRKCQRVQVGTKEVPVWEVQCG